MPAEYTPEEAVEAIEEDYAKVLVTAEQTRVRAYTLDKNDYFQAVTADGRALRFEGRENLANYVAEDGGVEALEPLADVPEGFAARFYYSDLFDTGKSNADVEEALRALGVYQPSGKVRLSYAFSRVGGVGDATVARLWESVGNLEDVRDAAAEGSLTEVEGIGPTMATVIAEGINGATGAAYTVEGKPQRFTRRVSAAVVLDRCLGSDSETHELVDANGDTLDHDEEVDPRDGPFTTRKTASASGTEVSA